MGKYINKAKVVAEIERRIKVQNKDRDFNYLQIKELESLLSFLDTLEVKDVDLDFEKELYKAFGQVKDFTLGVHIARHFFELGIKAQKGDKL